MGFTKYTKTEGDAKVLSPDQHKRAEKELHKQGKTSAKDLSQEQRDQFNTAVQPAE